MKKIAINSAMLALSVAFASGPALAQDVSQTYPMTISSPAFGPGVPSRVQRPVRSAYARSLTNVYAYAPYEVPTRNVSQIYPMTISSPAFGPGVR
jgi:hypothetical protein